MSYYKFTGRTNLGKALNRTISSSGQAKTSHPRIVYGILVSVVDDSYKFNVKILDEKNKLLRTIGPIEMVETPHDLAARFGSPQEMVEERVMVKISYSGLNIEAGKASVIKNFMNSVSGSDVEEVKNANTLPVQGTSFASPGASML